MTNEEIMIEHWRLARALETQLAAAVEAANALAEFELATPFTGPGLSFGGLHADRVRRWRAGLNAIDAGQLSIDPNGYQG